MLDAAGPRVLTQSGLISPVRELPDSVEIGPPA